jgi:hypothetical protein
VSIRRHLVALTAAAVLALAALAGAAVADGPAYGVTEDASKYADDGGASLYKEMKTLGMSENNWTLTWNAGDPTKEFAFLDRSVPVAASYGIKIVLTVYQDGAQTPDPGAFCQWVGTVARRYPSIKTFIIGNEVNASRFWAPQHTAADPNAGAASYYAVLTRCYGTLKGVDEGITVVGFGLAPRSVDSSSTPPLAFLRTVGKIYRADTARSNPSTGSPIMDELAVHPYANPNVDPPQSPDKGYENTDFYGVSQLDRVEQAAYDAFNGTAQPTTVSMPPASLRTTELHPAAQLLN